MGGTLSYELSGTHVHIVVGHTSFTAKMDWPKALNGISMESAQGLCHIGCKVIELGGA